MGKKKQLSFEDQTKRLTPTEESWLYDFTLDLEQLGETRRWSKLVTRLERIGVELPERCNCEELRRDGLADVYRLHENHVEFNSRVKQLIDAAGARIGMYLALYRESRKKDTEEIITPPVLKQYRFMLLDFLREKPRLNWFAPGPLYRGKALSQQKP